MTLAISMLKNIFLYSIYTLKQECSSLSTHLDFFLNLIFLRSSLHNVTQAMNFVLFPNLLNPFFPMHYRIEIEIK